MKTSAEDVYAAGDVINTISAVTGDHFPGRLGGNAVIQAKVAAINALGGNRIFPGVVNASATKVFDLSFGMAGKDITDTVTNKIHGHDHNKNGSSRGNR